MRKPYILYKRQSGIKKKKSLQYYVAFWDPERHVYSRKRATGQTSEAYADAQARKWLEEGIPSRDSPALADYLRDFWDPAGPYARRAQLRGRPMSADYLKGSRYAILRHVIPWLEDTRRGHLQLHQVTPAILEALVLWLSEQAGLAPRRVNAVRQAVAVPLANAYRLGLIREDPMRSVLRLQETRATRQILNIEEARKILFGIWPDERYRLINMLAAATGMRLGECRGLLVEDIVKTGGNFSITVRHNWQDGEGLKAPKWGTSRAVPLSENLALSLQRLAATNRWDNTFVFYGDRRDMPVAKRAVENAYNAALAGAEIPEDERRRRGLGFHAWRHWYNSMLRGQLPDHALRALTGHRSEAMTELYTELTDEQRKTAAVLSSRLFAPTTHLADIDVDPAE
jgi:integrase